MNIKKSLRMKKGQLVIALLRGLLIGVAFSWFRWGLPLQRRQDYVAKYSQFLALPPDVTISSTKTEALGPTREPNLSVVIRNSSPSGDDELRAWIQTHNGLTPWVSSYPAGAKPLGEWIAVRGNLCYFFRRYEEEGFLTLSFMPRPKWINADGTQNKSTTQ